MKAFVVSCWRNSEIVAATPTRLLAMTTVRRTRPAVATGIMVEAVQMCVVAVRTILEIKDTISLLRRSNQAMFSHLVTAISKSERR